jgi:hypothetical protein
MKYAGGNLNNLLENIERILVDNCVTSVEAYELLTAIQDNEAVAGRDEYNAGLSEIAYELGCTTEQWENIYWAGIYRVRPYDHIYPEFRSAPIESSNQSNQLSIDRNNNVFYGGRIGVGQINNASETEDSYCSEQQGHQCKRCGSYESDGAMFTTIVGGDYCDDCL